MKDLAGSLQPPKIPSRNNYYFRKKFAAVVSSLHVLKMKIKFNLYIIILPSQKNSSPFLKIYSDLRCRGNTNLDLLSSINYNLGPQSLDWTQDKANWRSKKLTASAIAGFTTLGDETQRLLILKTKTVERAKGELEGVSLKLEKISYRKSQEVLHTRSQFTYFDLIGSLMFTDNVQHDAASVCVRGALFRTRRMGTRNGKRRMAGLASCFANRESELIRANPQQQSTYWILLLELAAELSPFMARTPPSIRFCSVNSRKPT